jgi:hypothetical protein
MRSQTRLFVMVVIQKASFFSVSFCFPFCAYLGCAGGAKERKSERDAKKKKEDKKATGRELEQKKHSSK